MAHTTHHAIAPIFEEHSYSNNYIHPITGTYQKFVVGDRFHDSVRSGHKKPTCKFHNIDLCPDLKKYRSVTSEIINSRIKSTHLKASSQQNFKHYVLYNRLMDYWRNRDIIQKQYNLMVSQCNNDEYVTRDHLHRFIFKKKV